jgi:anti-sigma factor RsiW
VSEDDDADDRDLWSRLPLRSAAAETSTCPDPGTLAALVDGRLTPGEREPLEAHLAGCPHCVRALADVRLIERAPIAPVSPAWTARLARAVTREQSPPLTLPGWLAVAAMVALTCGAGFLLGARAMGEVAALGNAAGELPLDLSPVVNVP